MAYPYPTINEKRQYEHRCILPHKAAGINTYSQCVAAMRGCQRQAEDKYRRTGNATYAHFATTFHKDAEEDRLVKAAVGANASSAASNEFEYHGACKLLLSDCGRTSLWPVARQQMMQNLKRYHAQQPPATRADMPTMSCAMQADGSFACSANTFTRSLPLQFTSLAAQDPTPARTPACNCGAPPRQSVVWRG